MRELEMFFDYECPYCKKGYEDFLKLLGDYSDISVIWRPCEAHPRPEDHPPHTELCLQGLFYVQDIGGDVMAYHKRMYDAVHTDKIDVEDAAVLADYVSDMLDKDAYLAMLRDGTYAQVQSQGNDYAYDECGVWYLPAFRMDGKALDAQGGIGVSPQQIAEFLKG